MATIRKFWGILHHSRLNLWTFLGLSANDTQTSVVLSGISIYRTPFPHLTRIVHRNGIIHIGNASCLCPCRSKDQALCEGVSAQAMQMRAYAHIPTHAMWWGTNACISMLGYANTGIKRGTYGCPVLYIWSSFTKARQRCSKLNPRHSAVAFLYTPVERNGTLFSDTGTNEITSVLHKYKTPVTKCCILTSCWVNLVCIRHLIVKMMPEKHAWGPDFLMSDSPYIFQLFEN